MRRIVLGCGAWFALAMGLPGQSAAPDDMGDGTWHGWLLQQDRDSIPVTYAVSHYDKHLLITLRGRSGITYDMSDANVKHDVLTFDWPMSAESDLYCRLTRRDGRTFEGTCNDRSPGPVGRPVRVWMLMNPPDTGRGRGPRDFTRGHPRRAAPPSHVSPRFAISRRDDSSSGSR